MTKHFKNKNIKVISTKNNGVSSARNAGIEKSSYQYIALLDADDWLDKDYLHEMSKLINEYPDLAIYGTRYSERVKGKNYSSKKIFDTSVKRGKFNLLEYGCSQNGNLPINSSSVIINKRLFFRTNGFDERITYFEDYDLFIRMGLLTDIGYNDKKPLSYYNRDVPADNRVTGSLVNFDLHMLNFIDKYSQESSYNILLKNYLDRFSLNRLLPYRALGINKSEMASILSDIDRGNMSWKYFIVYNTPYNIQNTLIYLNKLVGRVIKYFKQ